MKISAAAVLTFAVTCSFLTGCSGSLGFPNVEADGSPTAASDVGSGILKGRLHGGQQPIVGAKIYLLAAGTTGYGSAATSLLTSTAYPAYPAQKDSNGMYYVLTDGSGSFQIVDQCTPGQQVYVASVGGNPGAGNNTAANEIALLGQCPAAGNFDSALTGVFVSEISTVAATYAASAYAVDTFHIGGPSTTTLQQTAIANAFANAANLFDIQNMNDTARTTNLSLNGTVPQAKIHTIANVLAACINSTGPSSSPCSILFANAKTGGTTGTAPTDVTAAAINIAHNPWANVSALLPLQTAISPFSPQMAISGGTAPSDFSIAIDIALGSLDKNPSLAVDGLGNVWGLVPGMSSVSKISPLGALLSGPSGYAIGGGFSNSRALAVDTSNNLWVLGQGPLNGARTATFAELNVNGLYQKVVTQPQTILSIPFIPVSSNAPTGSTNLVLDAAGNFYYASTYTLESIFTPVTIGNCCTVKFNMNTGIVANIDNGNMTPGTNFVALNNTTQWTTSGGNNLSTSSGVSKQVSGGGLNAAVAVALDASGNAWAVNSGSSTVSAFSSTGAALSGSTGFGSGLSKPQAIAVDGLGQPWVTNSTGTYSLTPMTSAGAVIGKGYPDPNLSAPGALVIDASGNVWVASSGSFDISEFVGAAAPVVTPTAAAIGGGQVGQRP